MTASQIKKVDCDFNGNLRVNGIRVGESINMAFRVTTDSVTNWRADMRERFLDLMIERGKEKEARAILSKAPKLA